MSEEFTSHNPENERESGPELLKREHVFELFPEEQAQYKIITQDLPNRYYPAFKKREYRIRVGMHAIGREILLYLDIFAEAGDRTDRLSVTEVLNGARNINVGVMAEKLERKIQEWLIRHPLHDPKKITKRASRATRHGIFRILRPD